MDEELYFGDGEEFKKYLDADYLITTREKQSIDEQIYRIVKARAIVQKYIPTVPIPKGSREHQIATETELDPPIFGDDFSTEDLDEARKTLTTFYPIFMHKNFRIKKIDIDATRNNRTFNEDALTLNVRAATSTLARYKEKVLWRGYDISGRAESATNSQGSIDTNSKGIMNTTNVQTFAAGAGADGDIQAAGDGPASVGLAADDLLSENYYGPYWCFLTPAVRSQFGQNMNSTTHILDIERMQSMVAENGKKILRGIDVTPYLLNQSETSGSYAAMILLDPQTPDGDPTVLIGEEYPVTHYPERVRSTVIEGNVIWGGCALVLKPKAITVEEDITY